MCYPNQESANALLKILEEPKENNLFILVTSDIRKIIDTIKSRCTLVFFNDLDSSKIESELIKYKPNLDSRKAKIISKLSLGNMRAAYNFIDNIDGDIISINSLASGLKENNLNKWNKEFYRLDKDRVIYKLELLNLFFQDINLIKSFGNHHKISFTNFENNYDNFIQLFSNADWNKCIQKINDSISYIKRNSYLNLTNISLFIELQNIMKNDFNNHFNLNEWLAN